MRAVATILDRISAGLNRLAIWGAGAAVVVMTFSALYQVVARYIFSSPPIWTEELARYAMVWAGLLGASVAFRAAADPVLFPGGRSVPGGLGIALTLLRAAGVAIFVAPILYYSFFGPLSGYLARTFSRDAEMLGVSMIWFAVAIPIAFSLILLHLLADLATRFANGGKAAETQRD